ncbi:8885_t:CDS:2 [Acaulospora morrowiae]|uniref:8885_t:CDS:1 n=1 Tax=Acaulospora morrowiae TaxID=94023 RepID=A0A9N9B894_9GLOM|nr:8885_t:CDS:2 [Acaulospora morrowiae]
MGIWKSVSIVKVERTVDLFVCRVLVYFDDLEPNVDINVHPPFAYDNLFPQFPLFLMAKFAQPEQQDYLHVVLSQVFEYLDDRDEVLGSPNPKTFGNLFSCLLVNNLWRESAVSILWRHPFHRCHRRGGKSLIHTLLSCLDQSERQDLYNDGVFVPAGKYNSPVYDYANFIKSLDYCQLISSVKSWCKVHLEGGTDESVTAILRSILKLMVARSAHLKTLNIRSAASCNDDLYMLMVEPEICSLVKPVRNLLISCYFPKDTFLTALTKRCKNLHSLRIMSLNVDDDKSHLMAQKLALLIESQRGLKRVTLSKCKSLAAIVIPSLIKQKRTLRQVGFYGVDFEGCRKLDVVKSCSRLESLSIVDCYNMNFTLISPLIHNQHKRLQEVTVRNCSPARVSDKLEAWADMINFREYHYH